MRVVVPLALAASAVVALNLRGQDSNQVAPMDSPDDLRLLINVFEGPKEEKYRKTGGKWGGVLGVPLLLAQPMVRRAGKEIGSAIGRRQDRKDAKNEMKKLDRGGGSKKK
ncbi:unnamed protein product [Aphanomyces euteiches]